MNISDGAIEALATRNYEWEHGDGAWAHCPENARPGWLREARAQCEAVAAYIRRADSSTNDPRRIEQRKSIAPAFTVPRHG